MLGGMKAAQRFAGWARVEDWLLLFWVAVASPVLLRAQDTTGPFEPNRPFDGVLGLAAVAAAICCAVTTSSDRLPGRQQNILERASVGPLVGGLLLVIASAFDGLGLSETTGWAVVVATVVTVAIVRFRWPVLPTTVRRAMVTPLTLVCGNLFAVIIHQVTGGGGLLDGLEAPNAGLFVFEVGALLAFAAIFYTMLIYAPRQVAEVEGSPRTWLLRFAIFVAGTAFGLGWLGITSG